MLSYVCAAEGSRRYVCNRIVHLDAVERTLLENDCVSMAVSELSNLSLCVRYIDVCFVNRQRTIDEGDGVVVCFHTLRRDGVGTDRAARCIDAIVCLCTEDHALVIITEPSVVRNGELRSYVAVDHRRVVRRDGERSLVDHEVNSQRIDIVTDERYDSRVVTYMRRSCLALCIRALVSRNTLEGQYIVLRFCQHKGGILHLDGRTVHLCVVNEFLVISLFSRDVCARSGLAVHSELTVAEGDSVVVRLHTARDDGVLTYVVTALVLASVCLNAGQYGSRVGS